MSERCHFLDKYKNKKEELSECGCIGKIFNQVIVCKIAYLFRSEFKKKPYYGSSILKTPTCKSLHT